MGKEPLFARMHPKSTVTSLASCVFFESACPRDSVFLCSASTAAIRSPLAAAAADAHAAVAVARSKVASAANAAVLSSSTCW